MQGKPVPPEVVKRIEKALFTDDRPPIQALAGRFNVSKWTIGRILRNAQAHHQAENNQVPLGNI